MNLGLERALAAGFTPLITPTLVRPDIMAGTGFLGAHADEIYHLPATTSISPARARSRSPGITRTRSWMCRPAPALRRLVDVLPPRGRLRRQGHPGIIRVHQFQKLEMFSYIDPADAEAEHERLLAMQEGMLQDWGRAIASSTPPPATSARAPHASSMPKAWVPTQGAPTASSPARATAPTFQARGSTSGIAPTPKDGAGRDPERNARHHPLDRRVARDGISAPTDRWRCPNRCVPTSEGSRFWNPKR
jgi:seryl-tRNA synthetase